MDPPNLFALGGWSGETKDGDRNKWKPSLEMVAATVKFALETKRLAEGRKQKGVIQIPAR